MSQIFIEFVNHFSTSVNTHFHNLGTCAQPNIEKLLICSFLGKKYTELPSIKK